MHHNIEKLLILQDRDQKILRLRELLARIQPDRETLLSQTNAAQAAVAAAKARAKQIENDRKQREIEVEAKKQQIGRYSLQQFQTKKNEEYRALAHEIDTCKAQIVELEDAQLELMEQAEASQREILAASRQEAELQKMSQAQLRDLADREQSLSAELAQLEGNRDQIKIGVDEQILHRYERLLKMKGGSVIVGIEHGVCGGCHMRFPVQLLVSCQAERELVTCPNCGRILYYSSDMDLAVSD
jgi:predicted  nucleic acid-binding Zn-ribbon protein